MTKHACFTFMAIFVVVSLARAEEKPEAGFKSLFNGKDLSGWAYKDGPLEGKNETSDKRFLVEDKVIVAAVGKGIQKLNTVEEFNHDFHLKLEFRAAAKADSGVYVRGPQLQVRDFIRLNQQPGLKEVFKNDDWNEIEIVVKGGTTTCKLNGVAFDPKFKAGAKGPIGLQAETGKFEFRNLRIKEIK